MQSAGGFLLAAAIGLIDSGAGAMEASAAAGPPAPPYFSIQLASLRSVDAAHRMAAAQAGKPDVRIEHRDDYFLVRAGVWTTRSEAKAAQSALFPNVPGAIIVRVDRNVAWIGAAADFPAVTATAPAESGSRWWMQKHIALADIGLLNGMALEGVRGRTSLFFPVPRGVDLERGVLNLELEFAEHLVRPSTVSVLINGVARTAVRPPESRTAFVKLPITTHELEDRFVHVALDYSLFGDKDICIARDLTGTFVRITQDSGVTVTARKDGARTVRGIWEMLPANVRIGLPEAPVTTGQFELALQLASQLTADRRRVHLVAADDPSAQILIGAADELAAALTGATPTAPVAADAPYEIQVYDRGTKRAPVLVFNAGDSRAVAELMSQPWLPLAQLGGLTVQSVEPAPDDSDNRVSFGRLGFASPDREYSEQTSWEIPVDLGRTMGPRRIPSAAVLQIVSAPGLRGDPVRVHAYFNDELVFSDVLSDSTEVQSFQLSVPSRLVNARNVLRVVARRKDPGGDCLRPATTYPITLRRDSYIATTVVNNAPRNFAEWVPRYSELTIHLSEDLLAASKEIIPFLAALGSQFWPGSPAPPVSLFPKDGKLAPNHSFLVIGKPTPDPEGAIALNRGQITISPTRHPGIDIDAAAGNWSFLQTAQIGGSHGLWLLPASSLRALPRKPLLMEDENFAVFDDRGTVMAANIGARSVFTVEYSEEKTLLGFGVSSRYVMFGIVWILVVAVVLYLLRQTRRHSRGA
jgi:hypothetical protein